MKNFSFKNSKPKKLALKKATVLSAQQLKEVKGGTGGSHDLIAGTGVYSGEDEPP
ncbi:hypothetical protein [Lewinella cohaerens]|uniref:hypothetical protein n=1 Tax=Lewinella cohaerens TaxID=70995 RepID=UPI00037D0230|nr:hypothetical protein [Lewinella cohaerens]